MEVPQILVNRSLTIRNIRNIYKSILKSHSPPFPLNHLSHTNSLSIGNDYKNIIVYNQNKEIIICWDGGQGSHNYISMTMGSLSSHFDDFSTVDLHVFICEMHDFNYKDVLFN